MFALFIGQYSGHPDDGNDQTVEVATAPQTWLEVASAITR